MDPKNNGADKLDFLKKFPWDTCDLNADQERQLEEFLVEYHVVFAKRCFDVGYITEVKIKQHLNTHFWCMFKVHQLQFTYVMKF